MTMGDSPQNHPHSISAIQTMVLFRCRQLILIQDPVLLALVAHAHDKCIFLRPFV